MQPKGIRFLNRIVEQPIDLFGTIREEMRIVNRKLSFADDSDNNQPFVV